MFRRLLSIYPSTRSGQRAALFLIVTLMLSLGISSQIGIVRAATDLIVTTNDNHDDSVCDGDCTLVEAINAAASGDTIKFSIGGGGSPQTIFITTALPLPPIGVQVTIDGTTQNSAGCNAPPITLDGSAAAGDGLILGSGADGSTIRGLVITGFGGDGIVVNGANTNTMQCNTISNNGGSGVNVLSGSGNTISQNSITSNAGAGIALNTGANGDQAAPVLTLAQSDGVTGTTIQGTLAGAGSFTLEFFQCDPASDEGETLIGTASLTTGAINVTLPTPLGIGVQVTATATNDSTGDTSPFSPCLAVIGKAVYQANFPDSATIPIGTNLGAPLSAVVTVSNGGNVTLDITNFTLTNTTDFTLLSTPPLSIAGGSAATVDIEVQCNALAVTPVGSPVTTLLTVSNNGPGPNVSYTIECTVDPAPVPVYHSSPLPTDLITFGSVPVGSSSTANLIIDNSGSGLLNVSSPVFGGTDAADFTILSGLPIVNLSNSGSGIPVTIQCTPSSVGPRNADLTLTTDDTTQVTVNYPLSCDGVPPVITLIPATLLDTYEGDTTYSQTIAASGGTPPYTLVRTGAIPAGMNFDVTTGLLDGIPGVGTAGTYNFTITATDNKGFSSAAPAYSLIVRPPIIVTPTTLLDGTVGVPYNATIGATGGAGPYNFVVTLGSLPPPLNLNLTSGAITGTPTTAGTFPFTITVTDSLGAKGTQVYSVVINPSPVILQPTALTLTNATQGTPYTFNFTATGGTPTYTFSTVSALPAGLGLAANGTLSGTPTAAGTFTFDVTVTDSTAPIALTDTKTYTLTVDPFTPVVLQPLALTLTNAMQGTPYTFNFTATGGTPTYTFSTVSALPAGLGLAANGTLSGTPTAAGTFTFDVTVTDSTAPTALTDTKTYTLTVDPPVLTLQPPAGAITSGTQNAVYTFNFTATGGTPTYTFSTVSALPAGLGLAANGTFSGTPTAAGTFTFDVTVTDSTAPTALTDTKTYTLTINPAITLTPATLPNGTLGTPYNQTIGATGGSGTYASFIVTAGSLPPPLSLDPITGAITNTPNTVGTFPFSVTVTDSLGATGVQPYSITIDPAALVLQPPGPTLTAGAVGTPYSFSFTATGGTPAYTFTSLGPLPGGLSLAANGVLSGTPTAAGTFNFDVTVTDSVAATDIKTYSVTIDPLPPVVLQPTLLTLPNALQGTAYTFNFTAINGTPGYTFTTSSVLPPNLTLAPDGTLSGTPTGTGTFSIVVTVTDSTAPTPLTDTKTYSLTIDPVGTITLTPLMLPAGALTVSYSRTVTASPATTYTYTVTLGALPPGLNLNPTTGVISGIPTTIAGSPFSFTITATNGSGGSGFRAYSIAIGAAPAAIYNTTPAPNLSSSILSIGTAQIGTPITYNLIIRNLGTASMTINTPGGSPLTNLTDFAITSPGFPFQVGAAASTTLTIRCIPSAAGLLTATLTLRVTGDPNLSSASYPLQCIGSGTAVPTATPAGFVATATAFVIPPTAVLPATGTVSEVKGLAMRTGPYLGATLVGKIIPGQAYTILAQSNDEGGGITWYLVTTKEGVTGWVSGLYLLVTGNIGAVPFQGSIFDQIDGAADTGISARAMSIIDIRRRPSGRAAIIGQVPQDGSLHLMGRTRQNGGDFWVQVNYNGIIGWIPAAPISVRGNTASVPIR